MADTYSSFESMASELGIEPITDHVTLEILEYAGPVLCAGEKDGETIEVSPISLKVNCDDESSEISMDVTYFIGINYKDGSNYVVLERNVPDLHGCSTATANYQYICGTIDNDIILLFNRLVNTDRIQSIQVNDTIYTLR